MTDFNEIKDSYRESIQDAIGFSGANHEFFVNTKGEMINAAIRRHFAPGARVSVLDVGCGHGFVHPTIAAAGHRITGVETAAEVLDLGREANPAVEYLPFDGKALPFHDGGFDVAIAMCVLHHVPAREWSAFVTEMRRIVRRGGLMMVFEHNPLNPLTRYVVATCPIDKGVTLVRRRKLERMFRQAGCSKVRSKYLFFTPFGHRFFRWLDRRLDRLPLGAQYVTLAQL